MLRQLEWDPEVDASAVGVAAKGGTVTLTGFMNHITVAPRALQRDVRHRIVEALHRNANIDARHITVTISLDKAILTGSVGTWLQRESAERAAGDAPGMAHVENRIVVEPWPVDALAEEIC